MLLLAAAGETDKTTRQLANACTFISRSIQYLAAYPVVMWIEIWEKSVKFIRKEQQNYHSYYCFTKFIWLCGCCADKWRHGSQILLKLINFCIDFNQSQKNGIIIFLVISIQSVVFLCEWKLMNTLGLGGLCVIHNNTS